MTGWRFTPEQRKEICRRGGAARMRSMSAEQRAEMSRRGALSPKRSAESRTEGGRRGAAKVNASRSPEERKRIASLGGKAKQAKYGGAGISKHAYEALGFGPQVHGALLGGIVDKPK